MSSLELGRIFLTETSSISHDFDLSCFIDLMMRSYKTGKTCCCDRLQGKQMLSNLLYTKCTEQFNFKKIWE